MKSNIGFLRFLRSIAFASILGAMALAAFLLWTQANSIITEKEEQTSHALASQMSQSIAHYFLQQVEFASALSDMPSVHEIVTGTGAEETCKNLIKSFSTVALRMPEYMKCTVVSFISGKAIAIEEVGGTLSYSSFNSSLNDAFQEVAFEYLDLQAIQAIRDGKIAYVSNPKESIIPGMDQTFIVAVPIFSETDQLIGSLSVHIKLNVLNFLFAETKFAHSGSFELMVDETLYFSNQARIEKLTSHDDQQVGAVAKAIYNDKKTFFIQEPTGEEFLYGVAKVDFGYFTNISESNWYILFHRNTATFFAEQWYNTIIVISIFSFLFLIIIGIYLYAQKTRERFFVDSYLQQQVDTMRIYDTHIACGIIVLDKNFQFFSVNPVALDILGHKGKDMLGVSFRLFFGETAYNSFLSDLIAGSRAVLRNVMVTTPDDIVVFVDLIINALMQEEQQYIVTVMPVPATREIEERMKAVYEASPDVYCMFSSAVEMVDCSDSCVTFFEAPSKEMILENYLLVSPEMQPGGLPSDISIKIFIRECLDDGVSRFPWEFKTFTGKLIPCEVTFIATMFNYNTTIVACIRDMRVQKQFEQALKKEQSLLRKTFDAIPGNVSLRDASLRYVAANEAFLSLIDVTADYILEKKDTDIFDDELLAHMKLSDEQACNSVDVVFEERVFDTSRDDAPTYMVVKKALRTVDGDFDGILSMMFDISAQKAVEQELIEATEKAESSNRSKTAFLSNISHEIRTPMNAIVGFVQLFSRDNLNDRQRSYLEKIKDAADTLLGVINGVLELSKIEAGRLELEHIPFSLRQLLETLTSITTFAANEKHLPFEVTLASDLPEYLIGDPTRIKQILLNIINNSIKFTNHGHVLLNVDVLDMPTPLPNQKMLGFTVHDTGIGMSVLQLERIFKPFTQADASTTRKYGGTGLGLTICKQLAEIMGGNITVQSVISAGTSFMLILPVEVGDSATIIKEKAAYGDQTKSIKGISVLLVEDNMINQEIAMAILEQEGMLVDIAKHGAAAIEAVMTKQYDIIFMDMQMPVMDGLAATVRLRSIGAGSNVERQWLAKVPIIAMTANAMLEDKQRCLKAGMNDHLAKPFDASDVYALVRQYT